MNTRDYHVITINSCLLVVVVGLCSHAARSFSNQCFSRSFSLLVPYHVLRIVFDTRTCPHTAEAAGSQAKPPKKKSPKLTISYSTGELFRLVLPLQRLLQLGVGPSYSHCCLCVQTWSVSLGHLTRLDADWISTDGPTWLGANQ